MSDLASVQTKEKEDPDSGTGPLYNKIWPFQVEKRFFKKKSLWQNEKLPKKTEGGKVPSKG